MEPRKSIKEITKGEIINHTGELTIEGDVGESAEINLHNGPLTILGNIGDGVKIKLTADSQLLTSNSVLKMVGSFGSHVGSFTSCMISQSIGGVETLTGNVNINNRIFTNDSVTVLGHGKYKITAANNIFTTMGLAPASSGLATATIDGKNYQGKEIYIDGNMVLVDGRQPANTESALPLQEAPKAAKLTIKGNVGNVVTIDCDAPIEILGTTGNFCQISSKHSGLTAKLIGEETTVNVRNKITIVRAGKHCSLNSTHYGLDAESLDDNVSIEVRDAINIKGNVGHGCILVSKNYGLNARNIGDNVSITVRDKIDVHNIGANSQLTSANYGMDAHDIGDNVTIEVRDAISANSVGNDCTISSSTYGMTVSGDVGHRSTLSVRDGLIVGNVGNYCNLTSSHNKVRAGNVGSNATIQGRDAIKVKDVGDDSIISSIQDEVDVRNLGNRVSITAKDNVNIDGYCPADARLTSKKGKVIKAPQRSMPQASLVIPATKVQDAYLAGKLEGDLQHAMALSNAAILQRQGAFPVPQNIPQPVVANEVEVPAAYLCAINQTIMVKPVICILDGRTYEDAAIRTWFAQHNTAPFNRVALPAGKTIDDILVINRNIEDGIEEFRNAHPEMFNKNVNKI